MYANLKNQFNIVSWTVNQYSNVALLPNSGLMIVPWCNVHLRILYDVCFDSCNINSQTRSEGGEQNRLVYFKKQVNNIMIQEWILYTPYMLTLSIHCIAFAAHWKGKSCVFLLLVILQGKHKQLQQELI